MSAALLAALWTHLAACVLLVGAFAMLLLAGFPGTPTERRWDRHVMRVSAALVLVAMLSGVGWLLARSALFENRPHAALELRAVSHAVLDTWPGLVWLARHGVLLVLAAFLALRVDASERRNWVAARAEPLLLAVLVLGLVSASSHAAAVSPGTWRAVAVDSTHLVATGVWLGGLAGLALLLRVAAREDGADAQPYAVRAARRFSYVALLAMLALVVSGVMNAVTQVESVAALVGTTHGRLLMAKLAVLVPILVVAVENRTRLLPALSETDATPAESTALRRLAAFVALEAGLALVLLALAAAMTLTTPARHAQPVWPLPFRLSFDVVLDEPATRWRVLIGGQLVVIGIVVLLVSLLIRRRRSKVLAAALVIVLVGTGIGLPPIVVDAYPTSYRRPLLSYHAASIAAGMRVYDEHCARCHGATGAGTPPLPDLRSAAIARRHAGELFWLVSNGLSRQRMPRFDGRLGEAQRWDVINYIRALGAAESARTVGWQVEPGRAWLVAPDFTITVGPLAPTALRDYRGRRMVLLVLYSLPASRARMSELARMYDALWVMGVEVVAVPTHAPRDALAELGASPPIMFPVITDGAAEIVATYRMFAAGSHAELLIDRQGYLRAIWDDGAGAIQAQVETLNGEKSPPPFPDDHVH
jgi:putative copper export protein/cytochrome c5